MKALSTSRKYLRWLLWPGLALTTAGLVAGFTDTWNTLPIALLATGLILTLVSLLLGGFSYHSFWQSRSTQAGTNAVLATVSIVLILAVVNFLAVQYGPRLDLTEGGLFTLAPETKAVVKNLKQPVNVVVFNSALNPNDKQLLDSYRDLNDAITYEHINPVQDPAAAKQFNLSGDGREVHLEVDDKKLFVQPLGAQGLNEQDLTNKLAQLGRDRDAVVYFIQGHDEFVIDGTSLGYNQAAAALEADNFTVEPLNLAQTDAAIPNDADTIIIAGPSQAFFEPELDAIQTYLEQGGSALILIDSQTEPELDPLLKDWGITLDDSLIIDTSNQGQLVGLGPAAPLVTTYGDHPITEAFNNGRSFYPLARPVQIKPIEGIEATPLLLSNPQSFAGTLTETGELTGDVETSPKGPFSIGVVLTKEITAEEEENPEFEENTEEASNQSTDEPEKETEAEKTEKQDAENSDESVESSANESAEDAEDNDQEARLVVIGNAAFATDGQFERQLNGDVFLNSVTWLSDLDDTVLSIRPKEITNRRISMTPSRQILVFVLALIGFPLVGLIGAGITWLRRR